MSRPPTPMSLESFNQRVPSINTTHNQETNRDSSSKPIMTIRTPRVNLYRMMTLCSWGFIQGMTDGVIGSLLPFIEDYYHISYGIVSLLWLGNALGYILVGLIGFKIDAWMGKYRSMMMACCFQLSMTAIMISATKFPVICIAMFLSGIGCAINLGQVNIFVPILGAKYTGIYSGFYGTGAFAGPLLATVMTDRHVRWNYFYFVLLGLTIGSMIFIGITFRGYDQDFKDFRSSVDDIEEDDSGSITSYKQHDFTAALKDMRTWLGCVFVFFYQGSEVSMGGWVVTFILSYRKGDPTSVGFVSSGFWAGVTVGRFLLTGPLIKYMGNRRSVLVLALVIMLFDVLTWLVPEKIAAALFASLAGLFIGPIYPIMITLLTDILPRKIRYCSLVLIGALGSSGGSAVPFMVGMLSQVSGTFVLHPIFLGCYVLMFLSWMFLPNIERKGAIRNYWQRFW